MICARAVSAGLVALVALCGCTGDGDVEENFAVATAIVVDPLAFPQSVPCSGEPGAMQSYIATLVDRTDPEAPFVLPSSDPLPCSQQVQFRFIAPGHVYGAQLDGYEQAAQELVPRGGHHSGNRQMKLGTGDRDSDDRNWASLPDASPRWRIDCADRTAVEGAALSLRGCQLIEDRGTTAVTAVEVDPTTALGNLRCGSEAGQITSFDVIPDDPALPSVVGVSCPPLSPIRYEVGILPGKVYGFRIEASGPSGDYAASCQAEARDQRTVGASCSPLSSAGVLRIPSDTLLAAAGLTCGDAGFTAYVVRLSSQSLPPKIEPFSSTPFPCDESALFTPLPPGPYQAEIRRTDDTPIATCEGTVAPGETTDATCAAAP